MVVLYKNITFEWYCVDIFLELIFIQNFIFSRCPVTKSADFAGIFAIIFSELGSDDFIEEI